MKLLLISLFCVIEGIYLNAQKPNIIYIMTDDLGYADLSCYGRTAYQTPNIDLLAKEGIKCLNAYASAPVCTPTRTAFITGMHPAKTIVGLYEPLDWTANDSIVGLTAASPSIARNLTNAGYETFLVGKWHLGFSAANSPRKNGFDYFFGMNGGGVNYFTHRSPDFGADDLYENETPIQRKEYLTNLLTDKAIQIIQEKHTKPFFLSLMFNAPHWPWQGPADSVLYEGENEKKWKEIGSIEKYASMMKSLDDAIGKIIQIVKQSKNANNTIVIFTSDNGGEMYSDMGIYKGKKMGLWEGGIRVPAIVWWPGKIKPGTFSNQVLSTVDWNATITKLTGAKQPNNFSSDGINLMPILLNKSKEFKRTIYWRVFQRSNQKAVRSGNYKFLQDAKGEEYLFDLVKDPSESNNLKDYQTTIFKQLKTKMQDWEKTVLTPIPTQK